MSHPGRDPVGGGVGRGTLREWRQGAPGHRWPGACLLVPAPWLALLAGQELTAVPVGAVDREPKARGSPLALGRRCDRVRLGRVSLPEGAHKRA
jgi:hypothetical protein